MAYWKKTQSMVFLDTAVTAGPTWARLKLSSRLEIAVNAKTEDYDFIDNENTVTDVSNYQPSLSQENMCEEGDSAFDYLWGMFYDLPVGSDAETDCLVVFPKAGTTAGTFVAWKLPMTIILNSFNAVDKKITYDLKAAGDTVLGTVTVAAGVPTFVAAA